MLYNNFAHILSVIKRYEALGLYDEETIEYINQNEVGFKVSINSTKFISTKKHGLNYDWELKYDEIIGIAFAEKMIFDDDKQLLIFFRTKKKPIEFIIPTINSEEMLSMEHFLLKLIELFDLEHFPWIQDKTILAYPNHYRGKELFGFWKGLMVRIRYRISKVLGINYISKGVFLKELKKEGK